tara:strand:- start:37515 stop:38504 length:990 start_codon:yes stop_codon:yes gene_type:complete
MQAKELIKQASICHHESDLRKKCPAHLKERLLKNQKVLEACGRPFEALGLHDDDSFYPPWVIKERDEVFKLIAESLIQTSQVPDNYDNMSKIYDIVADIQSRVTISGKKIKYDMFRVKTGRLATNGDSFPILSLPRNQRHCIKPEKDFLVEFDYNAMDLRVLLGLSDMPQPKVDIHDWIRREVFSNSISRDESKKAVFSWLYGKKIPEASKFERIFNKENICDKFYRDGKVKNLYGRNIQCDSDFFAMNYIVQSTANDLFFEQLYQVRDLLQEQSSKIMFCIHDCFVLDFDKTEFSLLKRIKGILEDTDLGKFKVNIKIGKSYGDMRSQ